MILDKGICEIYRKTDTAPAGEKPAYERVLVYSSWFGDLDFVSVTEAETAGQNTPSIDRKIRVLDNAVISPLMPAKIGQDWYEIKRVFHGKDDDSGELIADISLQRTVYSDA